MNDRLVTLLGAGAALLLLVGLLFQPSPEPRFGKPTSQQQAPQGYLALFQWLQRSGVPTASLRERLTELDQFAQQGNILMLTLPASTALRDRELDKLGIWVAQGNTLLLMAPLNDTPSWTQETNQSRFFDDLNAITQVRFESIDEEDEESSQQFDRGITLSEIEALFSKQELLLTPSIETTDAVRSASANANNANSVHPLLRQVDVLHAVSDMPSSKWRMVPPCNNCDDLDSEASEDVGEAGSNADLDTGRDDEVFEPATLVLALADDSGSQSPAIWEIPQGNGRILLSGVSDVFSNRSLGTGGNARMLSNIIAWHLGSQGQFVVDDMHQGLSVLYDPDAFYKDPRLGYSVLFVLAFWLLYLVGSSNRLAPVVPKNNDPQQGDYIAKVGGFMSRKLAPADAAVLMFERWFAELESRMGDLGDGANLVWERLLALPTVDPTLVSSLQALQAQAQQGQKIDLADLHNQLQQMRKRIG